MAKDKERKLAFEYYVNQLLTAKDAAAKSGVTEKTVGDWIKKFGWKALRNAKSTSTESRIESRKELIDALQDERFEIIEQMKEAREKNDEELVQSLRKDAVRIADEVSKWEKEIREIRKDAKVTLSIYIEVMEDIFKAMEADYPDLYAQSLDFQDAHLNNISIKLG